MAVVRVEAFLERFVPDLVDRLREILANAEALEASLARKQPVETDELLELLHDKGIDVFVLLKLLNALGRGGQFWPAPRSGSRPSRAGRQKGG